MQQPTKLLEGLYTLTGYHHNESDAIHIFEIDVDATHTIFEGHFPGHPVMPGVAMLQIIKELTEWITGKKLFMEKCTNVKFMALIEPEGLTKLRLELEMLESEEGIRIKNTTRFNNSTALRVTAFYKVTDEK